MSPRLATVVLLVMLAQVACIRGPTGSTARTDDSPPVGNHTAHTGDACSGIRVTGSPEFIGDPYTTTEPRFWCVDETVEGAEAVCTELLRTAGCPTLEEFVGITHWFSPSSELTERELFRCRNPLGPDMAWATFGSGTGRHAQSWRFRFDAVSGRLLDINRSTSDVFCCEDEIVAFANYDGYWDDRAWSCGASPDYRPEDFGLNAHSGAP